jgi:hypothetical protein
MSFLSRLFSPSRAQALPGLRELLDARGAPPDLPGLDGEIFGGFGSMDLGEREAVADAVASLHRKGLPLPAPWRDAQDTLMPQLVPTWRGERDGFYYRPCFDNVCVRILADGAPVSAECFALWDMAEDDAMLVATDRLEALSKDRPFVKLPSGIYASDFGDGLDSSRVLLPRCWERLFPGQNTFLAIPRPGALLVAPQVLLPKLVEAIGASLRDAGGDDVLAATMYQWVDGKVMPASLQEPHPMIQPQRELRQMDAMAAYAAQAAHLEKTGAGAPCPLGMVKTQQGRSLTVASWVQGGTALLPDCDLVGFVSSGGRPLGLYWRQTLPRLQRVRGEAVEVWGPRRLAFAEFPTEEELGQLECFAPPEVHAKAMGRGPGPAAPQPQQPQQSTASGARPGAPDAASASVASSSPVPAHLRGLSLGVQDEEDA